MGGVGALRHATGAIACQADFCSTTTAGSWFQSPTVLVANELRSPDEDAPISLNLNRWFTLDLQVRVRKFLKILSIYIVSRFWLVCTNNCPHN